MHCCDISILRLDVLELHLPEGTVSEDGTEAKGTCVACLVVKRV